MAEIYGPFDSGPGATFIEDDWSKLMRAAAMDGVIYQYSTEITSPYVGPGYNGLKVTAVSGMDVSVGVGLCNIHGFKFENTAAKTLTATASPGGGQSRHDIVVVRLDRTANTITTAILAGTAAATGSQVDPALTRGPSTWEIPLARLLITGGSGTIGTITDYRRFAYIPAEKTFCRLKKHTTAQTMAEIVVTVPTWLYDSVPGGDSTLFNSGTNEFLIPVNGRYTFSFYLSCSQATGLIGMQTRLKVNAAEIQRVTSGRDSSGLTQGIVHSCTRQCFAGDLVKVEVMSVGNSVNTTIGGNAEVHYLGSDV